MNNITKLKEKFQALLGERAEDVTAIQDFKFILKEKTKIGALQTFAETVTWSMKSDLICLINICWTFQASSAKV